MAPGGFSIPHNAEDLLVWLVRLFPTFGQDFDASYFVSSDRFTPHGVCSEFSSFYLNHYSEMPEAQLVELFEVVELTVAADPHDNDPVANAMCTCFLENISNTKVGDASRTRMGMASRRFFDHWHSPQQ